MSFLDKMKFWKKDDLDFDELVNKDMEHPELKDNPPMEDPLAQDPELNDKNPFPEQDPFTPKPAQDQDHPLQKLTTPPPPQQQTTPQPGNDTELINSKLDTIKAMLDSMDQRLGRMERSSNPEKKQNLW